MEHAIKVDAVLAKPDEIDLDNCSKTELIELVNGLRIKFKQNSRQIEAYDSLFREEMCQFTSDMLAEAEEENELKIQQERNLVAESFLVKIEFLQEEIEKLNSKLVKKEESYSHFNEDVENLKNLLKQKENDFNQLMEDVNTFRVLINYYRRTQIWRQIDWNP